MVDQLGPNRVFCQSDGVSHNNQEMLRPRDGDVEPPFISQESEAGLHVFDGVGPDAVEQNHLLLTTLEGVDGIDFEVATSLTE